MTAPLYHHDQRPSHAMPSVELTEIGMARDEAWAEYEGAIEDRYFGTGSEADTTTLLMVANALDAEYHRQWQAENAVSFGDDCSCTDHAEIGGRGPCRVCAEEAANDDGEIPFK